MSLSLTQSLVEQATIQPPQDSLDDPWWHYRSLLEVVTRDRYMVKSLYAQIGVLHLMWLTTASAIGERQTSALLTLAMPHGSWFRIHRYRKGSST